MGRGRSWRFRWGRLGKQGKRQATQSDGLSHQAAVTPRREKIADLLNSARDSRLARKLP